MSRGLIVFLILLVGFSACNNKAVSEAGSDNFIELVSIRVAEEYTEQNKGYDIGYYFYLNLKNDSVFAQRKVGSRIVSRAGIIKGIAEEPAVLVFLKAGEDVPSGLIKNKLSEDALYNGLFFRAKQKINNREKFYYFSRHSSTSHRFRAIAELLLYYNGYSKDLLSVNKTVDTDSVLSIMIKDKELDLLLLPPRHSKPTIKFAPSEKFKSTED